MILCGQENKGVKALTKMESVLSKSKLDIKVNWKAIVWVVISFLLARVSVLDKLYPFGIAFIGACLIFKKENKEILLGSMVGSLTSLGLNSLSYYISILAVYGFFTKYKDNSKYSLIKASFIVGGIFSLIRLAGLTFGQNILTYDVILLVFEGILVFTMTYVFSFSMPIEDLGRKEVSNEKMICSFVTMALVLSGINQLSLGGASIKNIISIVGILLISYNQGIYAGGMTGIILGMIAYISNVEMPFIIAILGVGGLLAGLFRDLGKSGSIIGFILGNGIISFYVNGLGTSFLTYTEILVSSVGFILVYNKLEAYISTLFKPESKVRKDFENRRFDLLASRFKNMSGLLDSLADTFNNTIEEDDVFSSYGVYTIVDDIVTEKCSLCSLQENCWKKSYYTTYYSIFTALGLMESNLEDKDEKLREILDFCAEDESLGDYLEDAYGKYIEKKVFNDRLKEQRQVLIEQLEGLSRTIKSMDIDIYNHTTFNDDLEELLEKEIKNKRFDLKDIVVAQVKENDLEVYLEFSSKNTIDRVERIRRIVSSALGYSMTADYTIGLLENTNTIRLIKSNRFRSLTRAAVLPNSENGISGDNFTFGEIDTRSFVAISDGMGTGKKACSQSAKAIEILEKMMNLNMDKDMTIKTINDILRTSSSYELFTTMDLSFIDLYKGKLHSIKSGASPTFIKGKDGVRMINSQSLPIGLLKDVDFNIYDESIEDGDIIIMMSDGVLESNREKSDNPESWMKGVLEGLKSQNPQAIADEILTLARMASHNEIMDDMTVVVTKVWRN